MDSYEDVLGFWFPAEPLADSARAARQLEWWFGSGADAEVVKRAPPLLTRAIRGELDAWAHDARSRLALIIVLDQFSRSLFRSTPRAFAQDPKALALALEGMDAGHYETLTSPWEQTFFLLPLGHSEVLHHQDRAVALTERIAAEAPPGLRRVFEFSRDQARGHRDVIARFGRHPHRNAVLKRESTPEELTYLANEQPVHTRRFRG